MQAKNYTYTLWLFHIAMEKGPFNHFKAIYDDLPIKNADLP